MAKTETKIIEIRIDLLKGLTDIAELQKKIETLTAANKENDKSTAALRNQYAANSVAIKDYRQQVNTLIKESANEIRTTVQKTGHIEKLKAEVSNLTLQYERLTKAELEGTKGTQVLKNLTDKRAELSKLNEAYGNYQLGVGQYSRATNGLKQSISMLTGELPNLALSSRIFIMSLSNNWQGLSQALKMVTDEHKELTKQFNEGLIKQKPDSVIKTITKSILSWNTAIMIGVTLFTAFGERIFNWIGTLFKGEKAVEGLTNAQLGLNTVMETFNKTMKDGGGVYGSAISSIQKHKVALDAAKGSSELSKAALDDYNTSLGVTFGKATDVNGALKLIKDNETDYIAAMKNMAFANAFFSQSADGAVKIVERTTAKNSEVLGEASGEYIKNIEKAQKRLKEGASEWVNTWNAAGQKTLQLVPISHNRLLSELRDAERAYNQAASVERARQIEEIQKNQNISLQQAEKYYNEYAAIFKKNSWDITKDQNENTTKVTETMLRQFDYESKIMEERAKALEIGREKELLALDAEYNAKLVKSKQHIDRLKQQEENRVKGAKEARIKAEKDQEKYELALKEGKDRKILEIGLKYDKLQADNAISELKYQHDIILAQNELSAKEQYDLTVKYAEDEYIAKMAQLDLMNISEEEYIIKSTELWNQRQLAIANGEKKLTNDLHSENLARLNNELAALTTGKDAQFQDIDAVFNKKTETLNAQKAKELEAAGTNAELIKSIEAKYAAESIALEQWKITSKIEKYKFWADTALNVGSEVNKAITAFAEHELSVWAKANEGKANFDIEYEKKKIELQRKEAIREKALAVMNTTINTAAAIVGFLAKPSGLAGAALSVAAGITGAAQIAAILATPLPSMSLSGSGNSPKVERRTVTEKFHSGGTIGTTTGEEKPITALTGESVNTIATTQMFSPILSALNQIGGGKAITSGVNTSMGTDMLAAAFSKALRQMPAPRIIWSDFETASERQRMIENNRLVR